MNKYIILLFSCMAMMILPVNAELTTRDVASPEYLINHGHSTVGAEAVARTRAQANGVPYEGIVEEPYWEENPYLRVLHKIYTYIDPAADQDTFMNHDIRVTPDINDL